MIKIREFLWSFKHYPVKDCGSFLPNIIGFLHEDNRTRPAMLIIPGGGYCVVSPTESRLVADKFYAAGYHTFILTYTTSCSDMRDFLKLPIAPLGHQPLLDLSRAISCIRLHCGIWHVDPSHIAACGFSAGAHLTGSLAVHFGQEFLQRDTASYLSEFYPPDTGVSTYDIPDPCSCGNPTPALNRPDAVILSYPVITTDSRFWHEGSIKSLTGQTPANSDLAFYSLEKQVTSQTPPVFLWHTVTDDAVPVENSLLFFNACRKEKIPCELHLFPEGAHGLSTADEAWQNGNYGEGSELCMEQFFTILQETSVHEPERIPPLAAPLLAHPTLTYFVGHWGHILAKHRGFSVSSRGKKDECVALWPSLAMHFLNRFGF